METNEAKQQKISKHRPDKKEKADVGHLIC